MKLNTIILSATLFLTKTISLNAQSGLIHTDPNDIKNTSIMVGGSYTSPRGASVQTMVNHYFKDNLMLYYSGNYFLKPFEEPDYRDAEPKLSFNSPKQKTSTLYHSLGIDLHFSERIKKTTVNIVLQSSKFGNVIENTIVKVESIKRKVWALHTGLFAMTGRERFYRDGIGSLDKYYLLNTSTGSNVDVINNQNNPAHARSIFSNASIFNLELGLCNKEINATGYQSETYGKKYFDAYTEWYIVGILPIFSSIDKDVFLGQNSIKYQITENVKPKPGFKIGFNFRTSLKSKYSFGADFGFLPSVVNGNTMYFGGRLGLNLLFGKVSNTEPTGTETRAE